MAAADFLLSTREEEARAAERRELELLTKEWEEGLVAALPSERSHGDREREGSAEDGRE